MFSNGQLLFAGLFVVVFIAALSYTYKKDKKLHHKNYKGYQWIIVGFATFIGILFLIKHFLKN
ncbi:hypothetical protein U1E44_13135 [Arenibacter sp. GZD96]|uniref:hypothetical protein n=1 Tax=Aurantibrevibacter litoralis TaxID=3106030 RepID=UPI002AFF14C5|nr:hypothetical protein [Arenibacter sp. GZD-96]MEA1787037.1 hypothetical protein [Arenibacter sp. GZD-96]